MLLWALFLATVIPTALPVILVYGFDFTVQPAWAMSLVGVLGMVHSGATGYFYAERKPGDSWRMVWVPLLFVLMAIPIFLGDVALAWPYFVIHYGWLIWHLGRQNFGLYTLLGQPSPMERFYFDLLPVMAMPAAMTVYTQVGVPPDLAVFLRVLSLLLTAYAVLIFAALLLGQHLWHTWGDWRRPVALFLGLAFFLPTTIGTHPALALGFFAHPIQYLIMVAWVSGRRSATGLALMFGCGVAVWALLTGLQSMGALVAFSILAYGITQAHFLIDGDVWKRGRAVV